MKYSILTIVIISLITFSPLVAQPLFYGGCWLKDTDGRYFNPKGFVVNLEDGKGKIEYSLNDYRRMIRYGANVQVIRIAIGQLAGLQGNEERNSYLERIDDRVEFARLVGMKTIFKMTVYGLKDFNHQWETIFQPNGENRKNLFIAWEQIWKKYANDPTVIGYDFLNEAFRQHHGVTLRTYEDITQNSLIPLYKELIHRMAAISQDKWAIYQPLLIDQGDRGKTGDGLDGLPMWHMQMPQIHDRMIYAPHGYFAESSMHARAVEKHLKDAAASGAALMMGEWGRQTYTINDTSLAHQFAYTQLYAEVANIFDNAGMGLIKAWFGGTRSYNSKRGGLTWYIFSDTTATGNAERKYIVDVISRPYPLFMAGCRVNNYGYSFTNRTFSMQFTINDYPKGNSEIYIPEERHYPDGFTVILNNNVVFVRDRMQSSGLLPVEGTDKEEKRGYFYDAENQRLIIKDWDLNEGVHVLKIIPGIFI
jgi:endoglycosylceramidase